MLKRVAVLICVFAIAGCSEPEPQVIDIEEAATNAGLASEDYEVNENGAIEIKSKMGTPAKVEDVITAFKDAGLPLGEVIIQTAETDPNERLGRPGEYIGSAQFEDSRVTQLEQMSELETDEPNMPLGGTIEVFDNEKDLQVRKQYIEQVYEMMPSAKQYMYANKLALLRLEYELTPDQAKKYETVFMSL